MKNVIYTFIGLFYFFSSILLGIGLIVLFEFKPIIININWFNLFTIIFGVSFISLTPFIIRLFFNSTLYESQKEIDDIREKYYSERDKTIKLNQELMRQIERLTQQIK